MSIHAFLKFIVFLGMPPASLAVGVVLWLLLGLVAWRRLGRIALGLAIAQTIVLASPPVTDALVGELERRARLITAEAPACCYDAIVVLGGGIAPAAPPAFPDPDLTESADRVWKAARLYHAGAAPVVIVSGGSYDNQLGGASTSEAEAMRRFLLDLGVPDRAIVLEGESLNTIENIRNVRAIVAGGRVAIVTSAMHVPRAAALAQRAGLNAAFFGTDWWRPSELRTSWENWLPQIGALGTSNLALREFVALSFDRRGDGLAP